MFDDDGFLTKRTKQTGLSYKVFPSSSFVNKFQFYDNRFTSYKTVGSLMILCICALIIDILCVLLMFQLIGMLDNPAKRAQVYLIPVADRSSILELAIALTAFILCLNAFVVVINSMQTVFILKLLQLARGNERACRYISSSTSSRYASAVCFYVSIPLLILTFLFYLILQVGDVAAIVIVVIILTAVTFTLVCTLFNIFLWKKQREEKHHPVDLLKEEHPPAWQISSTELSTLV